MDLKDGTPLHKQISDWLREQIESGALEPNEKLLSENELSKKFDVSRVTVRKALQTLDNEQLIYRCQGLGSFVSDQRTHRSFAQLNDFSEELEGSGLVPGSKVLSFEQVKLSGSKSIASYLNLKEDSIAVKLERIRLGDGQPIAYDITWMPVFYGQLIEGFDLEKTTIFEILENEFEIPVKRGCYRLEAAVTDDKMADYLNIEEHKPVLQMNRISYTIGEKPIYFQKRFYRNDKMVFEVQTHRGDAASPQSKQMDISDFNVHLNSQSKSSPFQE